ncbi:protein myomaker isoform X3 [Balaenoptera ricei]|uniref:protein myomaker isoform X3 n=1 Tax=Balaenoptera ricei TaxID=2746895 RepID=UPI0028BEACC2|nr:protein myomaker isoform X3 [Balaenoptera ricei]
MCFSTCVLTPLPLFRAFKPQLPPEPLVEAAGLLPFSSLPWRPRRPAPTSPRQPMGTLVAKLLLPTLSSLAFLPTLYHACNGPGLSVLCFLRHDILEYFSVYGTALSMWVSLMALADFDEPKRSTLVMFGVLTIAVRIYHDRWGYGVYSGPIGTAVLIIAAKWLQQMKETRRLYPDKSVYTQQIGPGLCFGALALMLRFFFEDWDYTYVHSFYHCALAMAFVLLLPKVNKKAGSAGPPAKLDCSTLCCACI